MKKRMIFLLLSLALLCQMRTGAAAQDGENGGGPFSDVSENAWYAGYVGRLAAAGVVGGYEDGSFRPAETVTWGQALKLILRASGFPEKEPEAGGHWASGYLRFAKGRGFPVPDARELDEAVTRFDVADLTAAALELNGITGSGIFTDTARPGPAALYAAGIMEGELDAAGRRIYRGGDPLSRAEACAVLTRVLDYVDDNFVFVGAQRAPVNLSLSRSDYDPAAFHTASNGRVYYSDPDYTVRYGIDVSYYQGDVDWKRVAADGVEFAIVRCGFRGSAKGSLNEDVKFREYIEDALEAGLDVGVYFFSQAVTPEEAREEARYTLDLIRGYRITLPVVFDWEQLTNAGSRTKNPDWAAVTDCAVAFCETVAAAGYTPMTYFNKSMAYLHLDMNRLSGYDAWLAWYHPVPDYIYEYQMWQYGSSGSVDGIRGDVDMDILFVRK